MLASDVVWLAVWVLTEAIRFVAEASADYPPSSFMMRAKTAGPLSAENPTLGVNRNWSVPAEPSYGR